MFLNLLWRSTVLSVLVLPLFGVSPTSAQTPAEFASRRSTIAESYGRLPLSFEANRGQTDKQVKFLARGIGYGVFLTRQEAVLTLHTSPSGHAATPRSIPNRSALPKIDVLRMQLLGANPAVEPQGADPLSGTVNYFRGKNPSRWQSGVQTFAKVKFSAVYPGVDLVYYGNQGQLEYDFVVAPEADPEIVRLHFAGAGKLQLTATGDLTVRAKNGRIVFHRPVVYQEENGRRQTVHGRFRLLADNSVGFALGNYDHDRPLVIDPALIYSTYLGGSTSEEAFGIAVDAAGNTYIAGVTSSADFPTTAGSYQTAQKSPGHTQAFVTKLNSTGTALVYSTYLGGSGDDDSATAIAVNAAGNAYITGFAQTPDFPTTAGAFQTSPKSTGGTGFVSVLNSTGTGLVYSTFLGGTYGSDHDTGIAVDGLGAAYVTGSTQAHDYPTTAGAFATTIPGPRSSFVTKLNSSGAALAYSTYLGGTGYDDAWAIAVDATGNAFVVGSASSHDFPVTAGAFQQTNLASSGSTGFVAKLNPAGSALVYSTYLGGSTREQVKAVAVDAAGTAYVAGHTSSSDFPVTSGAFQGANKSGAGFVTHLNSTGSALDYSTYLGPASSQSSDGVHGIRVDASGEAYVTGNTLSGFPVTPDAFQSTCSSLTSAYVTRLNATGTALVYSTCLGGTRGTFGDAIDIDAAGHAFVAGGTEASDFPVSSGAFQSTDKTVSSFATTGFVSEFDTNPAVIGTTTTLTPSANPAALGQNVTFDAGVSASSGNSTPDGNVAFTIDGADVATVALNAGTASYQTAALTAGSHTVKATYQGDSEFSSSNSSITETIQRSQTTTPVFSPSPGTYTTAQSVTISDSTAGAAIYYTTNGATPTTGSTRYTSAISVTTTETIKAIATATNYTASAVASATYTIQTSAVATFTPASLDFGNQATDTSSTAKTVTLKNTGNATLTLTGFPISGVASFSETGNCGSSLAAGASCALSIVFTPQALGAQTATLSVNSNTSGTAPTVALTGTGVAPPAPVVTLTPGSLAFGNQTQGTHSKAQTITVKNTGTAALTGIAITLSEGSSNLAIRNMRPMASDITSTANYSATTTCTSSLDIGASCTIDVTFSPVSVGSLPGTVAISDNAASSPQTAALSGTGIAVVQGEFTVSTTPSSATVAAGKSAQFNVAVDASGGPYNQAVSLTASGLPTGVTATFAPASVTPGSGTATSTLTIQTASANAENRKPLPLWPAGPPALALAFFIVPKRWRKRWPQRMLMVVLMLGTLGAAATLTGCDGGFALPHHSTTSTVTITATSGSDIHSATVQLTVN